MGTQSEKMRLRCDSVDSVHRDQKVFDKSKMPELCAKLSTAHALARKQNLDLVCHLIEMAKLEIVESTEMGSRVLATKRK